MGASLKALADKFECELHGDGEQVVSGVCTLQHGRQGAITFLSNRKYKKYLVDTQATAVVLRNEDLAACPVTAIVHDNPYACYARIAGYLTSEANGSDSVIHETAIMDESVSLGINVSIGAHAVIQKGVELGDNVFIGPGCIISDGVHIGSNTSLHSNITIYKDCSIGEHVLIHAGVVIGADGFGIAQDNGRWEKVPQLGKVRIGNDVEIGASTTIDRGAIEDTVIEDGVKLDNQIQVGHNVRIGAHSAVAGCVGIAGSADIGERCTIAAMTLVLGHIKLVDDVHITAQSMVTKSIDKPGVYSSGTPLQDNAQWKRNFTRFGQLEDMAKRLKSLEKIILNQKD